MKNKLLNLIASLSLTFGLATSALPKNLDYEKQRVEQYRQFYKEYHDKDYRIKKIGIRIEMRDGESKISDLLDIEHGNNLYDNKRQRFSMEFDAYLTKIDKEYHNYTGPDSDWYFTPYTIMGKSDIALPLESLDKENLPQVMKDILALPKDLQKKIMCVVHYRIDGDSWIMIPSEEGQSTVHELYNHLNKLDETRDAQQKDYEGQIQPIIPKENQFLPLDIFFPPVRYVDEDGDGKFDYVVELYSINGSWFNSQAEIRYIDLTQWFEVDQESPTGMARKYDKPFKITMDFDIDKDYEEEGYDISFFDEDHDGYFERYQLIEKKK